MTGRGSRRFGALAAATLAVSLACAGAAAAHPFGKWSGKRGPLAWESKQMSCGVEGKSPSRVRAHTLWKGSPANGYMRLTFRREVRAAGEWDVVQRQRHSTKNTALEGTAGVLHWRQWFEPFHGEAGLKSRHTVVFEWLRDVPGRDKRVLRRERRSARCTVGG